MKDTRSEIMDVAEKLIRTKGYNGFSYKDISSVLHIKNAAVHYHFPSKSDLGVAIIQRTREEFYKTVSIASTDQTAMDKLKRFMDIYSNSHKNGLVCFMGALGPSFESLPTEMKKELALAGEEIRNWVIEVLEEGKQKEEFNFKGTAASHTDLIITSLLASLILNKVIKEDVLKNTMTQITLNI
jgi:TetR/AcrR family transcriptional regulator, transcriptional repressor for nem operon